MAWIMVAALPLNEQERLDALDALQLLDTEPEDSYDELVRLAAYICGTPIAAVSLIDSHRQWFKAAQGLHQQETPRDQAFCAHTILQPDLMIVPDARADARFADNPLVTDDPGIRFYAGAPLVTEAGYSLGSLCVIDKVPRKLTEEQSAALRILARQAVGQMERARLERAARHEAKERQRAEREMRSITDASPVALALNDEQQNITFINAAFTRTFGYTRNDIPTLAHWWPLAYPDPHYRNWVTTEWQSRLAKAKREGTAFETIELTIQCKDGKTRTVIGDATPLEASFAGTHLVTLYDITDQRRADNDVRFQALLLSQVRNAVIATDQEGRITHWNRFAETLYQWSAEEVIGRSLSEVIVPPADRAAAAVLRNQIMERGNGEDEFLAQRKDGTQFPIYMAYTMFEDADAQRGLLGVSIDITERREAEKALRTSEESLSLILHNIQDVVFLLEVESSGRYRFLFVNPAFLRQTGLPRDQIVGRLVEEVLPETAHSVVLDKYAEAIRTRSTISWQETSLYPAGKRVGDVHITPLFDDQGVCSHLIGAVHDVTEKKGLQEQVIRSERLAAMGELVASVAHEINNPLSAISGMAQLLQMHPDPQVKEDVQTIRQMTDRAARIVRSLLSFARQQESVDRGPLPLRPLIEGTLDITRYKLRKNNISLSLSLAEPDMSPVVNAGQIEQVLLNLINNAEFALRKRASGGAIAITTRRVREENGDWALLSVSDNGQGIPEEVQKRIFDPFFTTKSPGEGTGLGLSICYGIVKEHQGRLEVSSQVGAGATFTIMLPLPT